MLGILWPQHLVEVSALRAFSLDRLCKGIVLECTSVIRQVSGFSWHFQNTHLVYVVDYTHM